MLLVTAVAPPPQVCVRGSSPEGCVLQQLSGAPQQAACRALWSLMEQRSQLLFVHEYVRRAHAASAFGSKLALLGERWAGPQPPLDLVQRAPILPISLSPLKYHFLIYIYYIIFSFHSRTQAVLPALLNWGPCARS